MEKLILDFFELDNNGVAQNYLDELINLMRFEFNESHQDLPRAIGDILVEKTGDKESIL